MNPGAPITGEVDTAAILKQINLVKNELTFIRSDVTSFKEKTTQKFETIEISYKGYTDNETEDLKKMLLKKISDVNEALKFEDERQLAEFE